ncbi:hypothetical protein O181_101102 [Austropuccinia psidii MF-1]|uniref:Reverse transcriptase domain-containing protein n=1 Tax=Austropuccinia psidii MF-1 TaxID=1389203 RepID=A0A9Q3JFB5_9BASI|nr:hypothetical protein [Austropuccinia psidii MF-1]
MDLPPSSHNDPLEELWDEEEEPEEVETVLKVVPSVYHQNLDVFSNVKAEKLPPQCACDHHIELEGSLPPIDLCGAYNLLRIKEGDENLTCFRTKYGSYEYFVMPFGVTNAPASFQNVVNDIFQDLLNVYVVVYLDDIMVLLKSEEEHVSHVSTVLSRLRANNLFDKASKCLFHVSSVEYLGYVVSSEGLKMNQAKVQHILNWPPPTNLKALQSFLGLANLTAVSSRIIQRRSVHSPVPSRKIPVSSSMRKLLVSFTNSKRLSPPLQSYPISIVLYPPL